MAPPSNQLDRRKHMNSLKRLYTVALAAIAGAAVSVSAHGEGYSAHPQADAFVKRMVDEHEFDRDYVQRVLGQAQKQQKILDAIARPAEKTKPWYEYREIFLGEQRITQGVAFWDENEEVLAKVAEQYGVDPAVIVAIIGVETRYGNYMGSYRVLDALTTLGFDYPPRATFFAGQLEQFFLLSREQKQDPLSLMGSYAGAMGYGQFIPSSYRHYARDFDGDGVVDIWNNKKDAIASVANYFKAHGWQNGAPVVAQVTLAKPVSAKDLNTTERPTVAVADWRKRGVVTGAKSDDAAAAVLLEYDQPENKEYWLGFNNFYVITRYNRSHMYALAVWQLSEAIRDARAKAQ